MDLQNIKRRIFKDEEGISNYINVSIEEMDWLVEQAEKVERLKEDYAYWKMKWRDSVNLDENEE